MLWTLLFTARLYYQAIGKGKEKEDAIICAGDNRDEMLGSN